MGKRHPNYRLVKTHRSYTVEETARLFAIHRNTVRAWIKVGLPTSDQKRPALILGKSLAAFLQARRTKNKRPCAPGEIYCVRCRTQKRPAGEMVEYQTCTEALGSLVGICPDCEGMMYRRVSKAKLPLVQGNLSVTFAVPRRQVSDSQPTIVNSDLQ